MSRKSSVTLKARTFSIEYRCEVATNEVIE